MTEKTLQLAQLHQNKKEQRETEKTTKLEKNKAKTNVSKVRERKSTIQK